MGNYKYDASNQDARKPSTVPGGTGGRTIASENTKRTSDPKRLETLLSSIGRALFDHIRPVGIEGPEDGMLVRRGVKDAIVWLRTTPVELMPLLNSNQATRDLAAVVVVLPSRVSVMITARFDVRIQTRRSASSLEVSVAQDNCQPKYFVQELTTGYDPAHALHLLVDPDGESDQDYVLLQLSTDGCRSTGWLDHDEAQKWAAMGRLIGSGSPPNENWEWRPPDRQKIN